MLHKVLCPTANLHTHTDIILAQATRPNAGYASKVLQLLHRCGFYLLPQYPTSFNSLSSQLFANDNPVGLLACVIQLTCLPLLTALALSL